MLNNQHNFFIYNYFNVSISVYVKTHNDQLINLASNIPPGKNHGINFNIASKYLMDNTTINIYKSSSSQPVLNELIGRSTLQLAENSTIRAIHCGMNTGCTDLSLLSDPVKSPLGTAIPRLRIVNTTPKTLTLTTTGNNLIVIPSGKSLLYMGLWENGIPLGCKLMDKDGILPTYIIDIPITDLFLGVISDIPLPLYNNITRKSSVSFDDEPGIPSNALEIHDKQFHKGSLIDTSYVPSNW